MWEQVRSNQFRSAVVVALIGAMLVATGAALGAGVGGGPEASLAGAAIALGVWLVLWVVAVTVGDRVMLRLAGAREVRKVDHLQLFNVVEEMTIAAALPAPPRVYIVDDPAPNAFATGRNLDNSAVTVTTGLLKLLDRDELQGVIAHEIGHVKNRDIKLMTTAGIMIGTIVILADLGRRWLFLGRHRGRTSRDGQAQLVLLVVAIVFMILAPILAQLLYLALSRRREFLADASGALFTRYPDGLASALEKLGASKLPLANASRATAPMYIVPPRIMKAAGESKSLWATHPPLLDRIRILRGMGGRADYAAYEAAYKRMQDGSVIGASTLARANDVPVRAAGLHTGDTAPEERYRSASDALLHAAGYGWYDCACGATLKIPESIGSRLSNCPRCGRAIAAGRRGPRHARKQA